MTSLSVSTNGWTLVSAGRDKVMKSWLCCSPGLSQVGILASFACSISSTIVSNFESYYGCASGLKRYLFCLRVECHKLVIDGFFSYNTCVGGECLEPTRVQSTHNCSYI